MDRFEEDVPLEPTELTGGFELKSVCAEFFQIASRESVLPSQDIRRSQCTEF